MTFTYNTALTATRDQIRLLVGDVDASDPLIADEEIAFLVTQQAGLYLQAAAVCEAIAARFAREVDRLMGSGVQTQSEWKASQKYTQYMARAASLRAQAARQGAIPVAGGLSVAGKAAVTDDSDRVAPAFTTDLFRADAGRVS